MGDTGGEGTESGIHERRDTLSGKRVKDFYSTAAGGS